MIQKTQAIRFLFAEKKKISNDISTLCINDPDLSNDSARDLKELIINYKLLNATIHLLSKKTID